jgi:hypothetical protein
MYNANAHPAYQYFNADKSVALVAGQSIIFFVVFFV